MRNLIRTYVGGVDITAGPKREVYSQDWARNISGSRKGYWRLALTPQMNKALGLAYWRDQGLVSLIERYDALRSTT